MRLTSSRHRGLQEIRLGPERRGRHVAHHQPQTAIRQVLQDQGHLVIDADGEPSGPLAPDPQVFGPIQPDGQENIEKKEHKDAAVEAKDQPVQRTREAGSGQPRVQLGKGLDEQTVEHHVGQPGQVHQ